jgi:hypothetical protein
MRNEIIPPNLSSVFMMHHLILNGVISQIKQLLNLHSRSRMGANYDGRSRAVRRDPVEGRYIYGWGLACP